MTDSGGAAHGRQKGLGDILRGRGEADARVGFIELFFDLVFVFAVTQLSHYLIAHLSPTGALEGAMLFVAIWWVWVYTIWCTNWLNTEVWPVRLMLFAMMAGGLVLAMAIPNAFGRAGLVFALAYAVLQVGRSLFMVAVLRGRDSGNRLNFLRIMIWALAASLLWIGGGLAAPALRLPLWLVALAVDAAGPPLRFFVPGLGASRMSDWNVEAHHMSERCGLFVIIALGESVLLTGSTFSGTDWQGAGILAFVSAFITIVAMWWIYFHLGAEEATHHFAHAADRGRIARFAYTYLHMPIIAGIIVNAASDEMVIAHPVGHFAPGVAMLLVGGPALFLASVMLFKRVTAGGWRLSHLVGLALLGALFAAGWSAHLAPLALGIGVSAVLVLTAFWETVSLGTAPRVANG
ncbi:low temperature requirement protein A [Sphingobium aquiterrae]|uniref:low temperature requirement protein A n=1 Tax=Sphingobium aquiterrae TaxID=2038656 RepID=UPI003018D398